MLLLLSLLGFLSPDDIGTTALATLKVGVGPRASAMGESFTALSDDPTALYWNPAGLGQLKHSGFFGSHQEWFQDVRTECLGVAAPAGPGRLGLGINCWTVQGVEVWDGDNMPGAILNPFSGVLTAGYGLQVYPLLRKVTKGSMSYPDAMPTSDQGGCRVHVGGALKALYDDLGDGSSRGLGGAADLGVLVHPFQSLGLGLSAQNLGRAYYGSSRGYVALPTSLRLGLAFRVENLNLASDIVFPFDNKPSFHIGAEYTFAWLKVRCGYRTGPQDLSSLGLVSGLCLGLGIQLEGWGVDYADLPYGTLGNTHRLSLNYDNVPAGHGTLKVLCADAVSRECLAAELVYSGPVNRKRIASDYGRDSLSRLPEGWLWVSATYDPDYLPLDTAVYIWGDREQEFALGLRRPDRGSVQGTLMDATLQRGIPGRVEYQGKHPGEVPVTDPNYSFVLRGLESGTYVLTAHDRYDEYYPQTCTLEVVHDQLATRDFHLVKRDTRVGTVVGAVYFRTDSADIGPAFLAGLDSIGRMMVDTPAIVVELAGHTDPLEFHTTAFSSDWQLSDKRARAVLEYLTRKFKKLDPRRFHVRGYADTRMDSALETKVLSYRSLPRQPEGILAGRPKSDTVETPLPVHWFGDTLTLGKLQGVGVADDELRRARRTEIVVLQER